jgi:biotin carboxylase
LSDQLVGPTIDPKAALSERLRGRVGEAGVAIGYANAGTIEFLLAPYGRVLVHRSEHAHHRGEHAPRPCQEGPLVILEAMKWNKLSGLPRMAW